MSSVFQNILLQLKTRFDQAQGNTKEIIHIISTITGITLLENQVIIRRGMLIVSAPPTAKMAIALKKETILGACKEKNIFLHTIA